MAISESISPMRKHSEVCWSSAPDHTRFGYRGPPRRLRGVLTTMACVAFGMAIITTTIGSLTKKAHRLCRSRQSATRPLRSTPRWRPPTHRPSTQPRRAVRRRRAPAMTLNFRFAIRHVQKKSERSKPHGGPVVWQTCLHRGSTDSEINNATAYEDFITIQGALALSKYVTGVQLYSDLDYNRCSENILVALSMPTPSRFQTNGSQRQSITISTNEMTEALRRQRCKMVKFASALTMA